MHILLFTVPVLSTLAGGFLAIRFQRYTMYLLAVGAGLLLGAACLDLLPQAIAIGRHAGLTTAAVLGMALGALLFFLLLDASIAALASRWYAAAGRRKIIGRAGAGMLISHSFRDGMAIGAAYAASHPAGYAVACGIAAHDLGDGMNTILLATGGDAATRVDVLLLVADAVAPLLGGLLTTWWVLSARGSVILLVLAAGFFLQMAAGAFLPELWRSAAKRFTLVSCVLSGVAFVYAANRVLAL